MEMTPDFYIGFSVACHVFSIATVGVFLGKLLFDFFSICVKKGVSLIKKQS